MCNYRDVLTYKTFLPLLEGTDPDLDITYVGSGYKLDVFWVYFKGQDQVIGQLRCGEAKWRLVRFDLPESTPSPCPLTLYDEDDEVSGSAPGWDSKQGFLDSFSKESSYAN